MTDIEIDRACRLLPIGEVAAKPGMPLQELEHDGEAKFAKAF